MLGWGRKVEAETAPVPLMALVAETDFGDAAGATALAGTPGWAAEARPADGPALAAVLRVG
jgi:hypothetical protein